MQMEIIHYRKNKEVYKHEIRIDGYTLCEFRLSEYPTENWIYEENPLVKEAKHYNIDMDQYLDE